MRAQSQGHHTTDRLEERGVEEEALDDLPWRAPVWPSGKAVGW